MDRNQIDIFSISEFFVGFFLTLRQTKTRWNRKEQTFQQHGIVQLPFLFLELTKTEHLHKLSTWSTHAPSPFWLVRATVFMKTPQAEWLQWLHRGHVDIFVAINHQAQSGCIHDQPCHLSTLLLLSLWLSHFLSFAFTCFSCSTLNFLSLPPVLPFPVLFFLWL